VEVDRRLGDARRTDPGVDLVDLVVPGIVGQTAACRTSRPKRASAVALAAPAATTVLPLMPMLITDSWLPEAVRCSRRDR
jgi:hypothetical protein